MDLSLKLKKLSMKCISSTTYVYTTVIIELQEIKNQKDTEKMKNNIRISLGILTKKVTKLDKKNTKTNTKQWAI